MTRDPACPCTNCNPSEPHWTERWPAIVGGGVLYFASLGLIGWMGSF